jgi:hypothetical protein
MSNTRAGKPKRKVYFATSLTGDEARQCLGPLNDEYEMTTDADADFVIYDLGHLPQDWLNCVPLLTEDRGDLHRIPCFLLRVRGASRPSRAEPPASEAPPPQSMASPREEDAASGRRSDTRVKATLARCRELELLRHYRSVFGKVRIWKNCRELLDEMLWLEKNSVRTRKASCEQVGAQLGMVLTGMMREKDHGNGEGNP